MMKQRTKTQELTFLGAMLAVTMILDWTPLGAIPIGGISATISHLPTIITGIFLGPVYGLVMGVLFGIISMIHALTRPVTLLDPLFINPLVSVLPRLFIGVLAYYSYSGVNFLMKNKKKGISLAVGGIIGSLTNTILVLTMLYLVYAKTIIEKMQTIPSMTWITDTVAVRTFLITVVTTNGIVEAIVAAVLTSGVALAYFRFTRGQSA